MIKIINVSKEYKSKNKSFFGLKDINLSIEENEIVGVIGYSGAGKSTLIRILNGLIKPDIGTVYIDNIDINKINSKDLNKFRNKIGMVFQSFNLLSSLTVYQNVELALIIAKYSKDQIHARVNEVLKLVGIFDQKDKYPKQLSGGQKQRVAIARAIANNPKYLLCDEITSALDISTSVEIINILKKIKEESNITIIFISHQINVVTKLCQRVVVMEKGQIIEDLPTIDLFIRPKEETTKKLISELNKDVIHFEDDVYKLIYLNNDIYENTLLSDMAQKYKTKFSILSASTVELVNKNIGILTVKIFGTLVNESVSFLKEKGLYVEKIIKKEGNYNE